MVKFLVGFAANAQVLVWIICLIAYVIVITTGSSPFENGSVSFGLATFVMLGITFVVGSGLVLFSIEQAIHKLAGAVSGHQSPEGKVQLKELSFSKFDVAQFEQGQIDNFSRNILSDDRVGIAHGAKLVRERLGIKADGFGDSKTLLITLISYYYSYKSV